MYIYDSIDTMQTLLCAYFMVCSFYTMLCVLLHWCEISSCWCCCWNKFNSIQFNSMVRGRPMLKKRQNANISHMNMNWLNTKVITWPRMSIDMYSATCNEWQPIMLQVLSNVPTTMETTDTKSLELLARWRHWQLTTTLYTTRPFHHTGSMIRNYSVVWRHK